MSSWKGNPTNISPNPIQENSSRSEKRTDENRSVDIRRDTDTQKNQLISLIDIDRVILNHMEKLGLTVTDEGNNISVPVIYTSGEKWVSIKRDGYFRDRQGKVQFPLIVFKRIQSESDQNIEMFNRYNNYPLIRLHSEKNKYTHFNLLTNKVSPVREIFNIKMSKHLILIYQVFVWTEYQTQMNEILEKIKFNTKDYWGDPNGFRFRVNVKGFSHEINVLENDDKIVKSEFNLTTNGYILPETYQLLDERHPTTEKLFTPKKIIMGTEMVTSNYDLNKINVHTDKWKSKQYPNIEKNKEPIAPMIDTKEVEH